MSTVEEKRALREQGLTYAEIARQLGISKQAVAAALGKQDVRYFTPITEKRCVYPNIRRWINENRVSVAELVRRMGLTAYGANHRNIASCLSGEANLRKDVIDKILAITGLTYEQAFYREKDNG